MRRVRAAVRARPRTLLAAAALLLALAAYAVWSVLTVRAALVDAQQHAREVQDAVSAGDTATARAALADFADDTSRASTRSNALPWKLASHLPLVGDDVRAVRVVAAAGATIGRVALSEAFPEGEPDLISTLAPENGAVDLAAVGRAREAVLALDAAFRDASAPVDAVRPRDLVGPLRGSYRSFLDKLDRARGSVSAAARAVQVLPKMLGQDRTQHYLLRFENNAEVRASGGIPGAWSLLAARDGKVTLVRQGSTRDFEPFSPPVLPPTPAERLLYRSLPGIFWQDTGLAPDFPRNAELGAAMWTRTFPGVRLDGVIDVDTVAVAHLLSVLGPIRTRDGVELDSGNAVDELLSKAYARYRDPADQDAFFAEVASTVFDRVLTTKSSPVRLLSALSWGVDRGRVQVSSFDDEVRGHLAGSTIAGELSHRRAHAPSLVIGLNDLTQAKMSYYLSTTVRTESTSCEDGVQRLRSTATFTSDAAAGERLPVYVTGPAERVRTGSQLVVARVYAPVGAEFGKFRVRDRVVPVIVQDDDGRQVAEIAVELAPGETHAISWTLRTAKGDTGDAVQQVTPGVRAGSAFRTTVESSC